MRHIRYALIGCGEHALQSHVLPGEQVQGLNLAMVCDPNQEAVHLVSTTLQRDVPEFTEDELDNDLYVDAVLIASPDRFHLSTLERAVRAGKHVLCEKPMATSVEEMVRLRAILAEATERRLVVTSCHPRRFDPSYVLLKMVLPDLIEKLGSIIAIGLDFSYHRPSERKTDLHHGLLIDHVNHELDLVNFLLGRSSTWMRRLSDSLTHYEAFGMRSDKVSLHFMGTRKLEERIYPEYITIRFERGHALLETKSGIMKIHLHESQTTMIKLLAPTNYPTRFLGIMQNFADTIRGTAENYLTHEDLIDNSEVGVALTQTGVWAPDLLP